MSTIHKLSPLTTLADLDIFTVPHTQLSILKNYYSECRPLAKLSPKSQIEFVIESSTDEYIRLSDTQLLMNIRVDLVKTGKVDEKDWRKLGVTNNLLHSLFRSVDVEIAGKSITKSPQTYAYKAYLETALGYTEDAKLSHLTASGFFPDAGKKKDLPEEQISLIYPREVDEKG